MTHLFPENSLYALPSDIERTKIFYWLKKLSSITAWRRILAFYTTWAAIVAKSVRIAESEGWQEATALPNSELVTILKSLAHCEAGVRRLSKGDKSVFKFDANGEFAIASRMLSHWAKMTARIDLGEIIIDAARTPLWNEFHRALEAACGAWEECAQEILEARYMDQPASTFYGLSLKDAIAATPFPEQIGGPPDPTNNILLHTGDWVTCSGIWEPIKVEISARGSGFQIFRSTARPPLPFEIMGTMNYLHCRSRVPAMQAQTANDIFTIDTTWRLLWKDDRYTDGKISAEEKFYEFNQPRNKNVNSAIIPNA